MSKFRLEDIVNVTFANTEYMKQKRIKDTFARLKQSLIEAHEVDDKKKSQKQQQYMTAFIGVMQKMNEQVQVAKQRYLNLNKEQLKQQKCEKLAEQIHFFREECFIYRRKLQQGHKMLKKQKISQQILQKQKEALLKNIGREQIRKKKQKLEMKQLKKINQSLPLNTQTLRNQVKNQYTVKVDQRRKSLNHPCLGIVGQQKNQDFISSFKNSQNAKTYLRLRNQDLIKNRLITAQRTKNPRYEDDDKSKTVNNQFPRKASNNKNRYIP